jgi:hypothetical protein
MAKRKNTNAQDGTFILKIVLYLIVGSAWFRLVDSELTRQIPLPVGLVLGLWFASHEHFAIDKKIEYVVLLLAAFIGFWMQAGVVFVAL